MAVFLFCFLQMRKSEQCYKFSVDLSVLDSVTVVFAEEATKTRLLLAVLPRDRANSKKQNYSQERKKQEQSPITLCTANFFFLISVQKKHTIFFLNIIYVFNKKTNKKNQQKAYLSHWFTATCSLFTCNVA